MRVIVGAELEHRATVEAQGVEAAAVLVGDGRVELLAALGERVLAAEGSIVLPHSTRCFRYVRPASSDRPVGGGGGEAGAVT